MIQNQVTPKWVQQFLEGWRGIIGKEMEEDYFQNILQFLRDEKQRGKIIYPDASLVFNAFYLCPFEKIKVVILGQDPYHGYGQAHGLSFSVSQGVPLPPSLKNIYKELLDDMSIDRGVNGCLDDWASQGVLLLNTSLTVEDGKANSHQNIGWTRFTDFIIRKISEEKEKIVFILWGKFAADKKSLISTERHHVLFAPHPSPLSAHRGFWGSKPFSKTNELLINDGLEPIVWG